MMRFQSLVICLTMLAAVTTPGFAKDKASEATPIVIGESRTAQSDIMGEERTLNIWLPPSYAVEEDRRYPVLYLIDGGLQQDFHHISGLAQMSTITNMFEEVIVVGVETKDRRAELTYPSKDERDIKDFPTHGSSDKFRAYIRDEVMPLINAAYRTNDNAALIGESLAGLFITEMFLKEPDMANAYIAISPSMWWDMASLGENAATLLKAHKPGERKLYLAIADEGGIMRDGLLKVIEAIKSEKPKGLEWTFSDRPDLQHSTIYHREALEALVWLYGKPAEEH